MSALDQVPGLALITPLTRSSLSARRATESPKDLETRLANARAEIEIGTAEGNFEKVLVNDVLDEAYAELKAQLRAWYPHLPASPS